VLKGEAGAALVRQAGHWHEWSPRWLPRRAARVVKRWRLRRCAHPVECRLHSGQRLIVSPDDVMQWTVAMHGGWEELIYEAIRPLVAEGSTVLDVGAHIGTSAVVFADWVGASGRVVCFEPFPRHVAQLARNVRLNGFDERVTIEAAAVSDRRCAVAFGTRDAFNGGMSAIGTDEPGHLLVPAIDLDAWTASRQSGPIALAKIDVEGAEWHVLRGMKRGLAARMYRAILVELHPQEIARFGHSAGDVLAILTDASYQLQFWVNDAFTAVWTPESTYVLALAPGTPLSRA
jgi:FkbM family methyltransferase